MPSTPIAVLADIHGNRWALEVVLDDIRRRGIRHMCNLGDCLYGPLDPAGTARILMELDIPTVRGNEDRALLEDASHHPDSPSLAFCRSQLAPEHLAWLRELPFTAVSGNCFLCHGSPRADNDYLLWEVAAAGAHRRLAATIAARLAGIAQPIVLCGHDHLPSLLALPDGRFVINPGSVGLPAYRDSSPHPHAMEAGSPHARYAIIVLSKTGIVVEHIAVPYDWESTAAAAAENGRADWAHALRTGFAIEPGNERRT